MELASRDAELAAKHEFFVGDQPAVLGLDPVVPAVVGDVDDLLAKAEIGSYLPRARIALVKLMDPNSGSATRKWVGASRDFRSIRAGLSATIGRKTPRGVLASTVVEVAIPNGHRQPFGPVARRVGFHPELGRSFSLV